MDGIKSSSRTYPEHRRHVKMILKHAESIGAEFKLTESTFAGDKAEYWGFTVDATGRKPAPGKVEQLANWPPYGELADIKSHVHFA